MNHPEVIDRLAILNAAHPRRLSQGLHHPNQLRKSWYFFFFALPGLPEEVVHLRDWHFYRHFLEDANPPYTDQEIERYVEAWSQPGASAAMINYYRASVRQSQKEAAAKLRPISAPTLVIWGERDSYLGSDLAEPESDEYPTSTAWSGCPTRRTGCTTTRPNASTSCLSTSSLPRHKRPSELRRHGRVPWLVDRPRHCLLDFILIVFGMGVFGAWPPSPWGVIFIAGLVLACLIELWAWRTIGPREARLMQTRAN